MKYKKGTCSECKREVFLYSKGKCNVCYWKSKRNPLPKVTKRINPISKRRQEALKEYRKERDQFLKKYSVCQFPGCTSRDVTLHHSKGRIGSLLTDKRYFKSLCWRHHQYVEEHPEEAKKLELSVDRLT